MLNLLPNAGSIHLPPYQPIVGSGATPNDSSNFQFVRQALPTYLNELVDSVSASLGVDARMALSTLLSGMAAGVHGRYKVARPDGGVEPLGLFTVVLAGSTTGKTVTYKLTHRAHEAEDIIRYQQYRGASGGSDERLAFERDSALPSTCGRLRQVILQDTTKRALLETIQGVGESVSISVDEGRNVLETGLFNRDLSTLNQLYDGSGKATLTRAKGDVVMAFDSSLNLLLMVQPDIFSDFCHRQGRVARSSGFFARCLFTTASFGTAAPMPEASLECLEHYQDIVARRLREQVARLDAGQVEREILLFQPSCHVVWARMKEELRSLAQNHYAHVQDAANRLMQNVARIAAVMHCYSTDEGPIGANSLHAAWAIGKWHLQTFATLFPPTPLPPPPVRAMTNLERRERREIEDAQLILTRMAEVCQRDQKPTALKSRVAVRTGLYNQRFRTALMRLIDDGLVDEIGIGGQSRLRFVAHPRSTLMPIPAWGGALPGPPI